MKILQRWEKTIVTLVTAPINQNIAIIRISGRDCYQIVAKIIEKKIPKERKNKIFLNKVVSNKRVIDQVLLLCFEAPNSFTGEDVVEIHCHGNILIVNQIIAIIIENGADLALKGEFSKRAYFNGKINIVQANAINQLIKAENISNAELALQNFDQRKKESMVFLEERMLDLIGKIEVNIDYPEYNDFEKVTNENLIPELEEILKEISKLTKNAEKAIIWKKGINVVIAGAPNAGKSTLLNSIIKEEKSIVSPLAGTTRDVIEAEHALAGINLKFYDTAGIRKTRNQLESKGIERSKLAIRKADLFLLVVDSSQKWSIKEERIFELIGNKKFLIVKNKIDLKEREMKIPSTISAEKIVEVSAEKGKISQLMKAISWLFLGKANEQTDDNLYPFLGESWQRSKLLSLSKKITAVIRNLKKKVPVELIADDLQTSFRILREITGNSYDEEIIEKVFRKFCLGK